jgi:ribosome biogenesis GTPase
VLSNKTLLIDTPGIRELQLWDDEGGLEDNFHDILEVASECQFSDCQHETEPGCKVNFSVEKGELSQKRVENFKKQQKEIESLGLKKTIHDRRKTKGFFSSLRKQKKHKNKPAIEN